MLLAPNPSPLTGRGTNTYVLGRGDVAVIDPGPAIPRHLDLVEAAARRRGHTSVVLLTHHHPDHSEAAEEMALRLRAQLAAVPHTSGPRLDRELGDGEVLDVGAEKLEVLATPGHCRDHACYAWTSERAIFAGDLVAGEGFIVIDPPEGDMGDYLTSLARVREHRFGAGGGVFALLPGHGPAIERPEEYLDGYIAHRLAREARVLDALSASEPMMAQELLPVVYADTPETMYPIAARSLQAHLDKLVRDGRAAPLDGGFVRRD